MKEKSCKRVPKKYSAKSRILALIPAGTLFLVAIPLFVILLAAPIDTWLGLPKFVREPFNFIAAMFFVVPGFSLAAWSVWVQFTRAEGTPIPAMPPRRLLVKGPYAYCRNPMLLGILIFYIGIGVLNGSPSYFSLMAPLVGALLAYIKLVEERELENRFGLAYKRYKKKTPFIIPRKRY